VWSWVDVDGGGTGRFPILGVRRRSRQVLLLVTQKGMLSKVTCERLR
jgi:hypothetical protein